MLSVALYATLIPKSFLKCPGQELSEYMVLDSGEGFFTNLDFREVCPTSEIKILPVFEPQTK